MLMQNGIRDGKDIKSQKITSNIRKLYSFRFFFFHLNHQTCRREERKNKTHIRNWISISIQQFIVTPDKKKHHARNVCIEIVLIMAYQ